jgi:hypothetical protein
MVINATGSLGVNHIVSGHNINGTAILDITRKPPHIMDETGILRIGK